MSRHVHILYVLAVLLAISSPAFAQTRNASFVNPNSVSQKSADGKNGALSNTVVADPASIDAGETLVNVARRVTVFFYNGFRNPVQINDLTLNADGNVRSKVITDDCKTIKTLPVQDKCSVALEITPSSPGPWSVELLLNHSGVGRIARAEVNGSTLGKADEKSEGLAISKKIAAPLDFGTVLVGEEKAARTMLIENDSTVPLQIASIDLIAAEGEGLTVRKMGCKEGDELKPGESCPITVMWEPMVRGNVATDLIVRHSGNLGFVVVPIRGAGSAGTDTAKDDGGDKSGKSQTRSSNSASMMPRKSSGDQLQIRSAQPSLDTLPLPQPPAALDDAINTKTGSALSKRKPPSVKDMSEAEEGGTSAAPDIMLIGTVGGRAILGDAQDQTYMVGLGEKVSVDGTDVELLQLDPTRAVVMISGKRMNLSLRNKQTIAPKKMEKADDMPGVFKPEKRGPDRSDTNPPQEKHAGPDGSTVAPIMPSPPSSSGLNSTGTIGGTVAKQNSALSAQDVINLMK